MVLLVTTGRALVGRLPTSLRFGFPTYRVTVVGEFSVVNALSCCVRGVCFPPITVLSPRHRALRDTKHLTITTGAKLRYEYHLIVLPCQLLLDGILSPLHFFFHVSLWVRIWRSVPSVMWSISPTSIQIGRTQSQEVSITLTGPFVAQLVADRARIAAHNLIFNIVCHLNGFCSGLLLRR